MGRFLKRIAPATQFHSKVQKIGASIYFELDEPDFELKKKFNLYYNFNIHAMNEHVEFTSCPNCGNTEFSLKAKFCRICGLKLSHF